MKGTIERKQKLWERATDLFRNLVIYEVTEEELEIVFATIRRFYKAREGGADAKKEN